MLADQGMLTPRETEIEQLNLNNVIQELEAIKAHNGGKMPYYVTISKVVEARKRLLPRISINYVKCQMNKNKKLLNEIYSSTATSTLFSDAAENAASSPLTFAFHSTMSTSDFNLVEILSPPSPHMFPHK